MREHYQSVKELLGRLGAAAFAVLALSAAALAQGGPSYAELPNLHRVGERFYRGAQPRPGGLRRLVELGVNTVINLRGRGRETAAEEAEARALGLRYHSVELPRWGRPTDAQVRRVLEIIDDPGSGSVFVHCKDGVDRTGTVLACHRVAHEDWTAEEARAEAARIGMRPFQVWMRDYIDDFARGYRRRHASAGPTAGGAGCELDDRVGTGVRFAERAVAAGHKWAVGALKKVF